MKYSLLILVTLVVLQLQGQTTIAEVEGSVLIHGEIDMYQPSDTASLYIGHQAGTILTSQFGNGNTVVGVNAGRNNESSRNSFFGFKSGEDNRSGSRNSFFGRHSGSNTTTGRFKAFY